MEAWIKSSKPAYATFMLMIMQRTTSKIFAQRRDMHVVKSPSLRFILPLLNIINAETKWLSYKVEIINRSEFVEWVVEISPPLSRVKRFMHLRVITTFCDTIRARKGKNARKQKKQGYHEYFTLCLYFYSSVSRAPLERRYKKKRSGKRNEKIFIS